MWKKKKKQKKSLKPKGYKGNEREGNLVIEIWYLRGGKNQKENER